MESLTRAVFGVILAAAASTAALTGTFSLLGGTQHSYARAIVSHPHSNTVALAITESTSANGPAIRSYTIDMTKLMHMIAISDDFRQFMHVHPTFNRKTGVFSQTLNIDPAHAYTVYVDTNPKGIGQQVFRFAIPASAQPAATMQPLPPSTPSPLNATAGPYTVAVAKTTIPAQTMQMLPLEITKDGKPATDLAPYLGAAGHAVFIDTATLAYVHVHPMVRGASMDMKMDDEHGAGKAGPHLMMHVPALPVGTYKLWFQFQGGGKLYIAPFTITVK